MSRIIVATFLLFAALAFPPIGSAQAQNATSLQSSKKLEGLPTTPRKLRSLGDDAQKFMKRHGITDISVSTLKDCSASITCPDGTKIKCGAEGAGSDCLSGSGWVMCIKANGDSSEFQCEGMDSPAKSKGFKTTWQKFSRSMRNQGVQKLSTSVGPQADCDAIIKCAGGSTAHCQAEGTNTECLDLGIGVFCTSDELIAGSGPEIDLCVPPSN